ncbi:hypothetical protein KAT63_03780 [Candidatus Parcubacteria bacterium]|nr:hypothetical protein [Candidatus Parcubacteria bacterium]
MTNNKHEEKLTVNITDIEKFAEMIGKRSGGGSVRIGRMTFEEISDVTIKCKKAFDKKNEIVLNGKNSILLRIFQERGWPAFDQAIVIAGVRKFNVDQEDEIGFISLGCGSIDVEAAIELNIEHRELELETRLRNKEEKLPELHGLISKIGLSTEFGNGPDSLETTLLLWEPEIWENIKDIQFNRPAGIVIVTPYITLWCEGMSINNLIEMPDYMASVKMAEAIKIGKNLCEINNIK